MAEWKFLTNHAHVLLCVAHEPHFHPDTVMQHPNLQNSMLGDLTLGELVAPLIDPGTRLNGHAAGLMNGARVRAAQGRR